MKYCDVSVYWYFLTLLFLKVTHNILYQTRLTNCTGERFNILNYIYTLITNDSEPVLLLPHLFLSALKNAHKTLLLLTTENQLRLNPFTSFTTVMDSTGHSPFVQSVPDPLSVHTNWPTCSSPLWGPGCSPAHRWGVLWWQAHRHLRSRRSNNNN